MNLAVELARSGEGLKSGPLGFAVILVLCVASYFLFKSMSKHLKKVREEFPADTSSAPAAPVATDRQPATIEPTIEPTADEPTAGHTAGSDDSASA